MLLDHLFDLNKINGLGLSNEFCLHRRIQFVEKLKDLALTCLLEGIDNYLENLPFKLV